MITKTTYNYLEKWLDDLRSEGKYVFTLETAEAQFSVSHQALKSALYRLSKQGKIVSVVKGFYVIVPPEYKANGILPPLLFVDELMKYLGHHYYVSLLSAAAQYGAAHHAPQTFFVMTELPALRSIRKKGLHIRFVHTRHFPTFGLQSLKTSSGFLWASTPELTALDLVKFERNTGRLQRSVEVISELQDDIQADKMQAILADYPTTTAIQRLGYIFEVILENPQLSEAIWLELQQRNFHYISLISGISDNIIDRNTKWKININYKLSDEL